MSKTIVVTGGTGSFGTNFINLLLEKTDWKIRVFSRDEHKQEDMRRKLLSNRMTFMLGDVRDRERLYIALRGADYVVHAAAIKQVPMAESHPLEAILTNIMGSKNVAEAALANDVSKCLLVSTDKACYPLNLYGATKKCAESIFISANNYRGTRGRTKLVCTRYGNVLGSRGTLLPLLRKWKEAGSEALITNPSSTRFWIKMRDANEFVLNSLVRFSFGGEIYVPKMASAKLKDVFEAVYPLGQQVVIGNRPGDKDHETLVTLEEMGHVQEEKEGFVIFPEIPTWYSPYKASGRKTSYRSDNNSEWKTKEEILKDYDEWCGKSTTFQGSGVV